MPPKTARFGLITLALLAAGIWVMTPVLFTSSDLDYETAETTRDDQGVAQQVPPDELVDMSERRKIASQDPEVQASSKILLRGVVRDRSGKPIHQADIRVGKTHSVTDVDGAFTLALSFLPTKTPDSLTIHTSASGYVANTTHRSIKNLANIKIDLDLAAMVLGQVVDTERRGIANAQVSVYGQRARPISSDENGFFRIALNAQTPRHYLQAQAKHFVAAGVVIRTEDVDSEKPITLMLKKGSGVYGIVFGPLGPGRNPIENAVLQITGGKAKRVDSTVRSDALGAFAFTGTAPGEQTLTVQHPLFAPMRLQIEVPAVGEILELRVELLPGSPISGIVQSSNGDPIVKAVVTIRDSQYRLAQILTDKDGAFKTGAMPIGTDLRLLCRARGYRTLNYSAIQAGQSDLLLTMNQGVAIAGTVVQENGDPVQNFRARIVASSTTTQGKGGGKKASGGKASGGKASGGKGRRDKVAYAKASGLGKGGQFSGQTFVSEDGYFEIAADGLRPDSPVAIEVKAEGFASKVVEGITPRLDPQPTDHRITLGLGISLRCIVLSVNGQPEEGAMVQIIPADTQFQVDSFRKQGSTSTTTDQQGLAEFKHLAGGELRLRIRSSVSDIFLHTLNIPAGSTRWEETIRLNEQGSILGLALDDNDQPASDTKIRLSAVDVPGLNNNSWMQTTTGSGAFEFKNLPLGVYKVANLIGGAGKTLEGASRFVNITSRDPYKVTLSSTGVAALVGIGVTESGTLDNGIIRLIPLGDEEIDWEQRRAPRYATAQNGKFRVGKVELGRYQIIVWFREQTSSRWLRSAREIEVTKSGDIDLGSFELKSVPGK